MEVAARGIAAACPTSGSRHSIVLQPGKRLQASAQKHHYSQANKKYEGKAGAVSKGSQVTTTTSSSLQSHAIARRSLRSSGARGPRVVAFAQGASTGDGSLTPKSKGMGSFAKRVLFGLILGGTGGSVLIAGGFPWACLVSLVAYQASQEYFGFITSKGIAAGMQPPPYHVTSIISLAAVGMSFGTFLTRGRTGTCLAVAAFLVISTQLLLVEKPKFSQLSSSIFGLFYCGYLPACWIKLRMLSLPAVHTADLAQNWPTMLGGPTHITVGLVATFVTVVSIVAADVMAYLVGKLFGRTQLIAISPKKTVEGAIGGLFGCMASAVTLGHFLNWPSSILPSVVLGFLIFVSSLFGDLMESVMKRDAGVKDSGDLIPGHGGILDRFDSYMFTGALVYFFTRYITPLFGL